MKTLPWFKSIIVRQGVVQAVMALLLIMGVSLDSVDVDSIVGLVLGGVSAASAVRTVVARLKKPTPPITDAAVNATLEFNRKPQ